MDHVPLTCAGDAGDAGSPPTGRPTVLRMTGRQHAELRAHLFPGDGNEAVALALCGRGSGPGPNWPADLARDREVLVVHQIVPVPYALCRVRAPDRVTWSTEPLVPLLPVAARRGMAILKIHSHPGDYRRFSWVDDESDRDLFPSIAAWVDDSRPHASAVMLPDGRVFARTVTDTGAFAPIEAVCVAGVDVHVWHADEFSEPHAPLGVAACGDADAFGMASPPHRPSPSGPGEDGGAPETTSRNTGGPGVPAFAVRTAQAFGAGTVARLRRLSAAIVGVSGTGSPTAEMVARLGFGEVLLVDDDRVEDKNLSRILNATLADADAGAFKVDVLARAIRAMGLGTRVVPIARSLWDPDVVRRVAQADIVFGCMDSYDGRDLLNRLAAYYVLPYIDVGVRLDADGRGGVDQILAAVHYLQPDGSSMVSRGVFTRDDVRAAALRRADPDAYRAQVRAKYLRGIREERPAVISINMLAASLAVNEFLARLHGFRDDGNADYAAVRVSLTQARLVHESDGPPCPALAPVVGRGDTRPLLGTPELSVRTGVRPAA